MTASKFEVLEKGSNEPEFGEQLTFLTNHGCPYAQRTWIALNAKGIPYNTVHVHLRNKPEWWFKYNPLGRVPTLVWRDEAGVHSAYESLIVNELLNEWPGGTQLLPTEPGPRAHVRIVVDRIGSGFGGAVAKLQWQITDEASVNAAVEALEKELAWIESIVDEKGPYLLGSDFTLADPVLAPYFARFGVLEDIRGWTFDEEQYPKLARWWAFFKELPVFTSTLVTPDGDDYFENLKQGYRQYLGDKANGPKYVRPAKAE